MENGSFDVLDLNKEILFKNNADYEEVSNLDKIYESGSINENVKEYIMKKYEESNKLINNIFAYLMPNNN